MNLGRFTQHLVESRNGGEKASNVRLTCISFGSVEIVEFRWWIPGVKPVIHASHGIVDWGKEYPGISDFVEQGLFMRHRNDLVNNDSRARSRSRT